MSTFTNIIFKTTGVENRLTITTVVILKNRSAHFAENRVEICSGYKPRNG